MKILPGNMCKCGDFQVRITGDFFKYGERVNMMNVPLLTILLTLQYANAVCNVSNFGYLKRIKYAS